MNLNNSLTLLSQSVLVPITLILSIIIEIIIIA